MSGGYYDYAYHKVDDFAASMNIIGNCSCASPELRTAFRKHLDKISEAMKSIEWNDSCDGCNDETNLILACLHPEAEKVEAMRLFSESVKELKRLQEVISK